MMMEHGQDVKSLAWHPHEEVSLTFPCSFPFVGGQATPCSISLPGSPPCPHYPRGCSPTFHCLDGVHQTMLIPDPRIRVLRFSHPPNVRRPRFRLALFPKTTCQTPPNPNIAPWYIAPGTSFISNERREGSGGQYKSTPTGGR